MDCAQIPELGYAEISLRIHGAGAKRRIPIEGAIDLTNRCNLRCVHCYIRDTYCGKELSFEEICHIFNQIANAGCLWLCLSGGEPLLRPDFPDIYHYAKQKGFIITLFSNGTLLTPSLADFLAEEPPFVLEVSLYGMTEETYEKMTGVAGAFSRCMKGIELALERRIPLTIKTVVTTLNAHELQDMTQYAKSLGVEFKYDAMINPKIDGSNDPNQYRLKPEEIVSIELADPEIAGKLSQVYNRLYKMQGKREYLYTCGAGKNSFHITSDGKLNMCVLSRVPTYDLRSGDFNDGFNTFQKIRETKRTRESECSSCKLLSLCSQCPAWAELEHGDPEAKVEFLCQTAKLRFDAFVNSIIAASK